MRLLHSIAWRVFGPKTVRDQFEWLARKSANARPRQNHGQQVVHEIWWLIAEASNGSLHQYLVNSTGDTFHETVAFLGEVGALESQRILLDLATKAFSSGTVPVNREERCSVFIPWAEKPEHDRYVEELTDQLLAGLDQLMQKVVAYGHQHPKYFPELARSN